MTFLGCKFWLRKASNSRETLFFYMYTTCLLAFHTRLILDAMAFDFSVYKYNLAFSFVPWRCQLGVSLEKNLSTVNSNLSHPITGLVLLKWKRTVLARLWIKDLRRVIDGNKASKEKEFKVRG